MHAIETRSLTKTFGDVEAVSGLSLAVRQGEIFGFLGTNGAGKSTTMMMLTTLLKPTSGSATIAGFEIRADPAGVRRSIGYVPQESTADEYLTGRENLVLQARLNHIPKGETNGLIDEILQLTDLEGRQDEAVVAYSGGMRKRLDIAGGLLHRPRVLFLDEPTVGLDIQTRRKIWEYIDRIHTEFDMTIFVSTHYMEEADQFCDRVGIIDGGKMLALDSPGNLKDAMGNGAISVTPGPSGDRAAFVSGISEIGSVSKASDDGQKITVTASNGSEAVPAIFGLSSRLGVPITSLSMTPPTLDDVFLSYTGREVRDGGPAYDRRREHARIKRLRA